MLVGRWPLGVGLYLGAISWVYSLIDEGFNLTRPIAGFEAIAIPIAIWTIFWPQQAGQCFRNLGMYLDR